MPNYYDSMMQQIMTKLGNPSDRGSEYAASRAASTMEDDLLRSLLGGRGGGQPGGRYDYFRDYKDARASMGPSMDFRKQRMQFDKEPSEAMMYWNPYNPERWDDYGDQRNGMIDRWENKRTTGNMKRKDVFGFGR